LDTTSLGHSASSLDFESGLTSLLSSVEGSLVSLIDGALRSDLNLITEEFSLVVLVPLAFHVGGHDAVLDGLESTTESFGWVGLAHTAIEELRGVEVVLGRRVRDLFLKEFLLCQFKGWVVLQVLGNGLHGVLLGTTTGLLKFSVGELGYFTVLLDAVEIGIRLHHCLLLVLRDRTETSSDGVCRAGHSHGCSSRLLEGRSRQLSMSVLFLSNTVRVVSVLKLAPAWHLVIADKGVTRAGSLGSLQ